MWKDSTKQKYAAKIAAAGRQRCIIKKKAGTGKRTMHGVIVIFFGFSRIWQKIPSKLIGLISKCHECESTFTLIVFGGILVQRLEIRMLENASVTWKDSN